MLFPWKEGTPVLFHCFFSLQNRSCLFRFFFLRVFEASEGQREAGVEHETRPTGDNFLRAFPCRVCLALPARFTLASACLKTRNVSPVSCTTNMEADLNRHVDYCSVDFHCRVIFTCVRVHNLRANKIVAMFERLRVNVNVDPRIAFTFTYDH